MKKFAVSDCVYVPGLVVLTSEGVITYDPKSLGPESTISLRKALGYELVDFEHLLLWLDSENIEFKGTELPEGGKHLSIAEREQREKYVSSCIEVGRSILSFLKKG